MLKKRLLLYLAFVIYQVSAFIFTVMVDGHLDLLGLLKFIPWFKYISFIGVALLIVDLVWFWLDRMSNRRQQDALQKENTELKAKVYDYQEAGKIPAASKEL
jgi:membrane protein implicated in regulation of membrane protease activity